MSLISKLHSFIVSISIALSLASAAEVFAGTTYYQYDELDRLQSAIYDDGTAIQYNYDELGNKTQAVVQTGMYPVMIVGSPPTYYTSLQSAYNAAADGSTIQCLAVDLSENVTFDQNKSITVTGGFNAGFTANTGVTYVHGAMAVSGGSVTAQGISLQQ